MATRTRRGGRRRANGAGTIYPVETPAGKRWEIKIYDENGNRVKRRFAKEKEALTALDDARRRKDQGHDILPAKHTMADLFDAWIAQFRQQAQRGERSTGTLRQYEPAIRQHMRPALGHIDCRRLNVRDIEAYLAALPLSAQTRAHHRGIIRRALNVALKWGWVDQNVATRSDPIHVRRREVAAMSLADAEQFLIALKDDTLYSAFVVALYTGLRTGELAGLRVEDINLDAGRARVHQQVQAVSGQGLAVKPLKTHASAAQLELIPEVVAVLADTIGDRTTGYVWESAPGRPYWPTSFTHRFTGALKRAGLPHIRLHDLRHYFVSFLPQLDVHPAVAQKLARHASIGTTMNIYTSVEDGLKKQAMGRLHEALSNPVGPSTGPQAGGKLRIVG